MMNVAIILAGGTYFSLKIIYTIYCRFLKLISPNTHPAFFCNGILSTYPLHLTQPISVAHNLYEEYLKKYIKGRKRILETGYINDWDFWKTVFVQVLVALVPVQVRKFVFIKLLRFAPV